jgi:predicted aspartyl protease
LKASLPKAKRFSEIKPIVTELINKKSVIWAELKEVKKQVDVKELEIEGIRKQMEVVKDDKSEIKD